MSLKLELTSLDGLDESVKSLYKKDGDVYRLDVSDLPDVNGLKAKNDALLEEKAEWSLKNREIEDNAKRDTEKAVEAALAKAKESGDTAALEKSWQAKFDNKVTEMQDSINHLNGTVTSLTSGAAAATLANDIAISGSGDVLLPHIQKRLRTEMKDGTATTTVLGTDGKPSAMTIAELTEEFKANKAFAPLIVGSKGSGSGHQQQDRGHQQSGDLSALTAEAKLTAAREFQSQQ